MQASIPLKSNFDFGGRYQITTLRAKPRWIPVSLWLKLYHMGLLDFMVIRKSPVIKNLVVFNQDNGVNLFIQHLGGVDTYPLELDNASIGTGSTAPTDADTDLETPVLEDIIRATVDINVTDLVTEWFMTDDELPNGTYNEFGLKCGTQLFCRSIISPSHTKASGEDTLVEYTITGNNS